MGLLPVDWGSKPKTVTLPDGTERTIITKKCLRWLESEVERYIDKELEGRFKHQARINRILRKAR
jgi:hypothetical protein